MGDFHGLDTFDRRLLHALDCDVRRGTAALARALGAKRDMVAYRIKRLREAGILTGAYAVIDYGKLGYMLGRLYIKFQHTTPEAEREIIAALVARREVFTVYSADGDWDLAVGFLTRTLEDLDAVHREIQAAYKKYIYMENISVFLEYVHFFRNYLAPDAPDRRALVTGRQSPAELDEVDMRLLKLLSTAADTPLVVLARAVGITAVAVRQRIKRLERDGVILAYRAAIEFRRLGREYYKVDIELEDPARLAELRSFAAESPDVVYLDWTVGGSDFECDVELAGPEAFATFLAELKQRFPGLFRVVRHYRALQIHKYLYFPV